MGEFNELILKGVFIISVIAFFIAYSQRNRIQELERLVKKLLAESIRREIEEEKKNEVKPVVKTENKSTEKTDWSKGQIKDVENAFSDLKTTQPFQKQVPPIIETNKEETPKPIFIPAKTVAPPIAVAPPKKSRTSAEWESLIGGKILNRIGALAIIIGIGFFLKYAFNNNLISESMRVIIGFSTGAFLLGGGFYFKRKNFQIFSQGIVGAGIAALYLSAYSSFNYYHLVPQWVAMLLMVGVTSITFWQAFTNDSLVIALFGWLGGFLTPVLISTGQANEAGLFSYILLLNIGLLMIVLIKEKWIVLEPLTLLATVLYYYAWYEQYFTPDKFSITLLFLSLFWFEFIGLELYRIIKKEKKILDLHQFVSIANSLFFYGSLYLLINPLYHEWMGATTVIVAAVYLAVFLFIGKRRPDEKNLQTRYLLSAIVLSVIASSIQFSDFEISIAWAVESVMLAALTVRYKNEITFWGSIVLLALAGFRFIGVNEAFYISPKTFHFIINERALTLFVLLFSAVGSLVFYLNFENKRTALFKSILHFSWITFLFALITLETKDLFFQLAFHSQSIWNSFFNHNLIFVLCLEWMVFAFSLSIFGLRKKHFETALSGIILTALVILCCSVSSVMVIAPMELYVPFFNLRTAALLITLISVFLIAHRFQKEKFFNWLPDELLHYCWVVILFLIVSVETRDGFQQLSQFSSVLWKEFFNNNLIFVLCLELLALLLPLFYFGLKKKNEAVINSSFIALALVVLFTCGNSVFSLHPFELFFPVFNFRAAVLLFTAASIFIMTRSMDENIFYPWFLSGVNVMRIMMVTVIFIFITIEPFDFFEKKIALNIDKTLAINLIVASKTNYHNLAQIFISGLWLIYSLFLMGIGIYRSRFNIRIVAMVIFAITTGKVFFYDLSYLNTLHRIFSFIALGVILLLVSFLYQKYKHLILLNNEELNSQV